MDSKVSATSFKYQFTTATNSYEIVPLTKDNLQDTVDIEVKAFLTRCPTCSTSGCSEESFQRFTQLIAQRAMEDGMGIVCVESNTGKVVGAALSTDYYRGTIDPVDLSVINDGLSDVINLVFSMPLSDKFNPTGPNQVIDLFLLCVHSDYTGQRIGTELVRFVTDGHPVTSKADYVYAHCTSPVTYKITTGMGWKRLDSVDPRPYKNKDGVQIFEKVVENAEKIGLPKYEGIILVAKKLK